jgi:hypothetical protein
MVRTDNFSVFNFLKYNKILTQFILMCKTLHSVGLNGHIFNSCL